MSLAAVGIEHLDGRSPLRAEALENFWLLLYVDLNRDVVIMDKVLDTRIGVNLGVQPSTGSSHRSGVEIQQQRTLGRACLRKRRVDILSPCDRHKLLLSFLVRRDIGSSRFYREAVPVHRNRDIVSLTSTSSAYSINRRSRSRASAQSSEDQTVHCAAITTR
jgi:hypothetical protein